MELTRFDLSLIARALELMQQGERDARARGIIQSTETTVISIMHQYRNDTVFLVQPDKLEE